MYEPIIRRTYNHRLGGDLLALKADLDGLSVEQKSLACFLAHRAGLVTLSPSIKAVLALVCWRYGQGKGTVVYATALGVRAPKFALRFWDRLMAHMLHGKDVDDPTSAGGWNKQKLDIFLGLVGNLGWTPPVLGWDGEPERPAAANAAHQRLPIASHGVSVA